MYTAIIPPGKTLNQEPAASARELALQHANPVAAESLFLLFSADVHAFGMPFFLKVVLHFLHFAYFFV